VSAIVVGRIALRQTKLHFCWLRALGDPGFMRLVVRFRLLVLLIAAGAVVADAAVAQAQDKPSSNIEPPGAPDVAPNRPPLLLYVAEGEANACGEGCSEWIAAEGAFDVGSAQRLRAFVKRLAGRKLPIFFQSIGGIQAEALAVGRFMREQEMTAGVAKTVPERCAAAAEKDDACRALKQSGEKLAAELRTIDASCNSACVYALIGASVRNVPPGARLGVHSSKFVRIYPDGRVNVPSLARMSLDEKARMADANAEVRRYVRDMGVDTALFDEAMKVAPDHVHYLSRNEIAGFGIDTRDFEESRWSVVEAPLRPVSVFKFIAQAKGPTGKDYRASAIQLACAGAGRIRVGYFRGLGSGELSHARVIGVSVGGRSFSFPRMGNTSTIDVIDTGAAFEVRVATVGIELFEAAAAGEGMDIAESDLVVSSGSARVIKLSAAGLSHAISILRQHCGRAG
jgi:hypothetical protein